MSTKKSILIWELLFLFFIASQIHSQETSNTEAFNCDSLNSVEEKMIHISIDKHPAPRRSFAEIQNEFIEKIDTNLFKQNIFIKVFVDASGNIYCPKLLKGNNNKIDMAALEIVTTLKFYPAIKNGKNFPMFIVIPFYCNHTTETNTLIKRNGKWYDKVNK